ncbi:MAG: hypothetical protein RIT02_1931 [Planctomycetota bacterium]
MVDCAIPLVPHAVRQNKPPHRPPPIAALSARPVAVPFQRHQRPRPPRQPLPEAAMSSGQSGQIKHPPAHARILTHHPPQSHQPTQTARSGRRPQHRCHPHSTNPPTARSCTRIPSWNRPSRDFMPRVQRGYQDPPFSGYFDKSECLDWIDLQEQIMKTGIEAAGELPRSPQRFFPPNRQTFCRSTHRNPLAIAEKQGILPRPRILPGNH